MQTHKCEFLKTNKMPFKKNKTVKYSDTGPKNKRLIPNSVVN